jgi:hypothetical protein
MPYFVYFCKQETKFHMQSASFVCVEVCVHIMEVSAYFFDHCLKFISLRGLRLFNVRGFVGYGANLSLLELTHACMQSISFQINGLKRQVAVSG